MTKPWLSQRELDICRLSHLTYVEIGEKLGIAPRTAKSATDGVRAKLGVKNKRHIQDKCKELGLKL